MAHRPGRAALQARCWPVLPGAAGRPGVGRRADRSRWPRAAWRRRADGLGHAAHPSSNDGLILIGAAAAALTPGGLRDRWSSPSPAMVVSGAATSHFSSRRPRPTAGLGWLPCSPHAPSELRRARARRRGTMSTSAAWCRTALRLGCRAGFVDDGLTALAEGAGRPLRPGRSGRALPRMDGLDLPPYAGERATR